jgi:hypothetical protein
MAYPIEETASAAEAVARMRPIKDRIEPTVPNLGSFANRIQPQASIMGEARNPMAIRVPNVTCIHVINAKISSGRLYARVARSIYPSKVLQI